MVKRAKHKKSNAQEDSQETQPIFPYTTKPGSLRKFLEQITKRPKPNKINLASLKSWGLRDTNDKTIIRVIKKLDLVDASNVPTAKYVDFMKMNTGSFILGDAIKSVYSPLFEQSHEPHKLDDAEIKNLFNIHSGGGERTISLQIQTFKALCEHAKFGKFESPTGMSESMSSIKRTEHSSSRSNGNGPTININLHIHLPENKTRRDYEYMFEDIAKYIYENGSMGSDESNA